MTSIEACIPEWTREVSTYSNGELLKTLDEYVYSFMLATDDWAKRVRLAWVKILSAEVTKRGLKYAT